MNQVEHLLKLADEYQAGGVVDVCIKMLKSEPKSKDNAVKILHLATSTVAARDDQRLSQVRRQCYQQIEDMELTEAQRNDDHKNLEKEIWERVLVKRIRRLETFVQEIYPQFMGLVECCLWYFLEKTKDITPCPQHFSNRKTRENLLDRMKDCIVCQRMISQLVRNLNCRYGGDYYFDEEVITMIQDFEKIIRV